MAKIIFSSLSLILAVMYKKTQQVEIYYCTIFILQ